MTGNFIMERFHLTKKDKEHLRKIGYLDVDIPIIEITGFDYFFYSSRNGYGKSITADHAIKIIGREELVDGLGRATFHASAVRLNRNYTKGVYIESDTYKL
jgi:hypothetical protein